LTPSVKGKITRYANAIAALIKQGRVPVRAGRQRVDAANRAQGVGALRLPGLRVAFVLPPPTGARIRLGADGSTIWEAGDVREMVIPCDFLPSGDSQGRSDDEAWARGLIEMARRAFGRGWRILHVRVAYLGGTSGLSVAPIPRLIGGLRYFSVSDYGPGLTAGHARIGLVAVAVRAGKRRSHSSKVQAIKDATKERRARARKRRGIL
jgi:hypothetical protein